MQLQKLKVENKILQSLFLKGFGAFMKWETKINFIALLLYYQMKGKIIYIASTLNYSWLILKLIWLLISEVPTPYPFF